VQKSDLPQVSNLLPGPILKAFADVKNAANRVKRDLVDFRAKLEKANALVAQVEHGTTQLKAMLEEKKRNGEQIEHLLNQFQ